MVAKYIGFCKKCNQVRDFYTAIGMYFCVECDEKHP